MTLKEVLDAKGYHYDSIFTGRAIDIDFDTNIQKKVELDQATEFERKILYGILLDRQTLI